MPPPATPPGCWGIVDNSPDPQQSKPGHTTIETVWTDTPAESPNVAKMPPSEEGPFGNLSPVKPGAASMPSDAWIGSQTNNTAPAEIDADLAKKLIDSLGGIAKAHEAIARARLTECRESGPIGDKDLTNPAKTQFYEMGTPRIPSAAATACVNTSVAAALDTAVKTPIPELPQAQPTASMSTALPSSAIFAPPPGLVPSDDMAQSYAPKRASEGNEHGDERSPSKGPRVGPPSQERPAAKTEPGATKSVRSTVGGMLRRTLASYTLSHGSAKSPSPDADPAIAPRTPLPADMKARSRSPQLRSPIKTDTPRSFAPGAHTSASASPGRLEHKNPNPKHK